jgi:hypothetical protein
MAVGHADRRGPRRVLQLRVAGEHHRLPDRNAAEIHPEWATREGGELRLHPKAPPLRIVSVQPGRALVAYMPPGHTLSDAGQGKSPQSAGSARHLR